MPQISQTVKFNKVELVSLLQKAANEAMGKPLGSSTVEFKIDPETQVPNALDSLEAVVTFNQTTK